MLPQKKIKELVGLQERMKDIKEMWVFGRIKMQLTSVSI